MPDHEHPGQALGQASEDAGPVADDEAVRLFAGLADEPALVLAVSGGPDSTALLLLAARWRKHLGRRPKLLAVTIDHGLRPQARAEANAVGRLARALRVPHRTLRWTGAKPATGLQAAARRERYRRLLDAARRIGARCIVTAHTLDDQAETVLIRMARGSGVTGLGAMAAATPLDTCFVVRPLLDLPKSRLLATLAAARIPFADDPSNRDPRFTRARLRQLMPALAREGLAARRLAVLARRLRRADAALEAATDEAGARLVVATGAPARGPIAFDRAGFARLAEETALRLLGRAIAQVGDEGPVELAKLEALTAALRAALAGPGGPVRFRRTLAGALVTLDERLRVERAPPRRGRPGPRDARGGKRGRK